MRQARGRAHTGDEVWRVEASLGLKSLILFQNDA
jgi:hypothetical protein